MTSYFEKFKGAKTLSEIPYPKFSVAIISGVGGLIIIAILRLFHVEMDLLPCFIVPFGASAVLVFGAPAAPFSQPRNVIGGHVISALIGVAVFQICGEACWWSLALANCLAITVMAITKTIHPPAGATTFLPSLMGQASYGWAFVPVGIGAVIVVLVGLLYNNIFPERKYPAFWW